jgi:Fe-S-cluster-containing hydrogenase component 2
MSVMDQQRIWVDIARCTGCGACVDMCPAGAIALVDGRADVDRQVCTGCEACVDACPEGAIQPVIEGELVPVPELPVPAPYRPGPLVETAGATVAVAGAGLLIKAARTLAQVVGRWLTRHPAMIGSSAGAASSEGGTAGAGCRARHRWRGGW